MSFSGNERDPLFVGGADGRFSDLGFVARVDLPGDGRSEAFADLDGDGDLDLVVRQLNAPKIAVLRNDRPPGNHALEVSLRGVKTNRMGLGAVVEACAEGHCQRQEIRLGHGYLSSGPAVAHFGLGAAKAADVTVTWPTGEVQRFDKIAADSKLRITEGNAAPELLPHKQIPLGPAQAPALTLQSLAGASADPVIQAAVNAGKPVLVNVWAPGCKGCREEAPALDAWLKAIPGATPVSLSLEPDHTTSSKAAKKLGLTWPLALGSEAQAAILTRALDGIDLPTTLAFDAKGQWVGTVIGKVSPAALVHLAAKASR